MMKKILVCLITLLISGEALANISIFPYHVDFDTNPRRRIQSIRVINTSGKVQTYRISLVNFHQDKNGKLTEVKEDRTYFANKYLSFSPRQFTLKPDEVQTIHVARKSLANVAEGEYVSHLKISETDIGTPDKAPREDEKSFSVELRALFAVTLPVTIYKGENLYSKTELGGYELDNPTNLKLTLLRKGDISSRVNVYILDAENKQIGLVTNVKIYQSTPELTISVPIEKSQKGDNVVIKLEDAKHKKEIFRQAVTL